MVPWYFQNVAYLCLLKTDKNSVLAGSWLFLQIKKLSPLGQRINTTSWKRKHRWCLFCGGVEKVKTCQNKSTWHMQHSSNLQHILYINIYHAYSWNQFSESSWHEISCRIVLEEFPKFAMEAVEDLGKTTGCIWHKPNVIRSDSCDLAFNTLRSARKSKGP